LSVFADCLWWGVVGFPFELSNDMTQALLTALGPLAFFFAPTGRIEALLGDVDAVSVMAGDAPADRVPPIAEPVPAPIVA
jgi:hypothetical protein